MRTVIFLIAVSTAGIASAQPASRSQRTSVAPMQKNAPIDLQARVMAIRLGQIELDDMIDKIVSEHQVVAAVRSNARLASK